MVSVWQFASTRGLILLADAQSADPEELQVLDTFLAVQLVVRAPVPSA
jgi:aminoglycoside phosphotransferase family enzyme